jgi:enoyl-CoA hydratase/carnithine racemase
MAGETHELEVSSLATGSDLPSYRTLQTEANGPVATITLNRPRVRNAIDRDDAVRVVVLTGAPPAFCAGADLGIGDRTFAEPDLASARRVSRYQPGR